MRIKAQANSRKGTATDNAPSAASSRQCRQGQRCFITSMMIASVTVASAMRPAASTFGPRTGAAMRSSMNDEPHKADRPMSWANWEVCTG